MNRPSAIIYCDFDGTVTQGDVTDMLLTELADPSWRLVEAAWEQGAIGSRECLARQIPLIRGGWQAMAAQLQRVELDPTFPPFAHWCRSRGVPLRIVSDGLDRVITALLSRAGVRVDAMWANHLEETADGGLAIRFPHPTLSASCQAGLCKCRILEQDDARPLRIVIGDGRSDWCWAERADRLFAKSQLLVHCQARGIPCTPFEDFREVRHAVAQMLGSAARMPRALAGAVAAPMGPHDAGFD